MADGEPNTTAQRTATGTSCAYSTLCYSSVCCPRLAFVECVTGVWVYTDELSVHDEL